MAQVINNLSNPRSFTLHQRLADSFWLDGGNTGLLDDRHLQCLLRIHLDRLLFLARPRLLQITRPDNDHGRRAVRRRHLLIGQGDAIQAFRAVVALELEPNVRVLGLEMDLAVRALDCHRAFRLERVDDRLHDLLRRDASLLKRVIEKGLDARGAKDFLGFLFGGRGRVARVLGRLPQRFPRRDTRGELPFALIRNLSVHLNTSPTPIAARSIPSLNTADGMAYSLV